MLKRLELRNVGPASHLALNPVAPRFNFLTGDNGLGKSFLLETAWWVLTSTWHETPAVPSSPDASISYSFDGLVKTHAYTAKWDIRSQRWKRSAGRPANPGLVIYARVDGSFSVWDPARNYVLWQRADGGKLESPPSYQFSAHSVLYGLRRTTNLSGITHEELICAGLIDDWTRWQDLNSTRFKLLCRLLAQLGPDDEPLAPGEPVTPTFDDTRRVPTVRMKYGQDVPITYAPAGVKRITMLAYLLAWSFYEHVRACKQIGQVISSQIIVLIDEPETHLHPRWQRTVLPSLYNAIATWHRRRGYKPEVQFLVATHAPLVMASIESMFDVDRDALWKLDIDDNGIRVERDIWRKRGDVNRWLKSDVFDLPEATSVQIQQAIRDAARLSEMDNPPPEEIQRVNHELAIHLPEMDPFFIRWQLLFEDKLEGLK